MMEAKVDFTPGLDEMILYKLIDPQATQPDDFLKKKGPPIIIVPLNTTATITKYNVKDFLLGNGHKSTLELLTKNAIKPEKLVFERTEILDDHKLPLYTIPNGLPAEVEVIDSVNDLKIDDWDRVVGVFCVGKEWQFKGFKWENSTDLFNNVPGVYVMDQSEPSFDPNLAKDWKVGRFDLSTSTPLTYSRFLESFWKSIDSHIKEKKPWYVNSTPYWS
ncbi:hypothetical protein DSO57_1005460 [Entomophthora muscae]|uniref:Uncharacterized protein n=1 Tax=Entomophthora muscae TaxID=34485 RepID=A0ACC2T7L8_9FUNG|nr:hypothetical protein DSO57_1005460 [Entomophthora muscae]